MSADITCTVALVCMSILCTIARYYPCVYPKTPLPLPPGPPGLPWIGNVIGINANAPWLTYREWANKYGDIIHTRLFGKDIIIINSEEIATELLDKHSLNNSDRPRFITAEMCGTSFNTALLPYGDKWRHHRRFFHQSFRVNAVQRFFPLHHRAACQFLRQMLRTPEYLDKHTFEYTASIVLEGTYDYDTTSHGDELIKIVAKVEEVTLAVVRPEVALLAVAFPMLLNLPAWFPGMSLKAEMANANKLTRHYVETAFGYALESMRDSDRAVPSMVRDALQTWDEKGMRPDQSWMTELKETAASSFLAGSETSHSFLMTFFLMMMLNPAVQERAQEQIDIAVGKGKLPTMDDRPQLPFIDAILRETHRYSPVAPLLAPHAAMEDDTYRGYHIPKGAFLMTNLWSMTHDESRYPNPDLFLPERFLDDEGSLKPDDVEHIVYGFGRRICAGRYFADVSVWALMAKLLAVFKIMRPLDENGKERDIEPKFSGGLVVHPLPFQCRFVPRTAGMDAEKLEELIAASTP